MKILKPGKVEMRRFVCPKCGCIFVEEKTQLYRNGHTVTLTPECPCGWQMKWDNGEPYEEPMPKRTNADRLAKMLFDSMPQSSIGRYDLAADYLIAHGVTFREG